MLIKRGGIYRNIDSNNFPHYKEQGYEAADPEQPSDPADSKDDPEQSETPDPEKPEKPKGK
jgi:hypothetical protein